MCWLHSGFLVTTQELPSTQSFENQDRVQNFKLENVAQDLFGRHCLKQSKNCVKPAACGFPLQREGTCHSPLCEGNQESPGLQKGSPQVSLPSSVPFIIVTQLSLTKKGEAWKISFTCSSNKSYTQRNLFFSWKASFFKTPVLHNCSSSWARSWLLLTTLKFKNPTSISLRSAIKGQQFTCWLCSLVQRQGWMCGFSSMKTAQKCH